MKLFSHTYANYPCLGCGRNFQQIASSIYGFFLFLAIPPSIAFYVRELMGTDPVPWYFFFSVYGMELLLILFSGLLVSPFAAVLQRIPEQCPDCGSKPEFAGRYFQTGSKPHWIDYAVAGVFLVLNIAIWIGT